MVIKLLFSHVLVVSKRQQKEKRRTKISSLQFIGLFLSLYFIVRGARMGDKSESNKKNPFEMKTETLPPHTEWIHSNLTLNLHFLTINYGHLIKFSLKRERNSLMMIMYVLIKFDMHKSNILCGVKSWINLPMNCAYKLIKH